MEPQTPTTKKKTGIIIIGIIAVLAIIAISVFGAKKDSNTSTDSTPIDTATDIPAATTPVVDTKKPASASVYKDGTYTATGSYTSPGGPDHVLVTLTLKDDIVTAATVKPEPGDNTSAYYQNIFINNYSSYVIGKDISTIHLDKVSGSSLTPKGFNDAVVQIKGQAKA